MVSRFARCIAVRIAIALLAASAIFALASVAIAAPGAIVGGHGTNGCISNVSSPGFSTREPASGRIEILGVGVSGQVSCRTGHHLKAYVLLYELRDHKWKVISKGYSAATSTVVNPGTFKHCKEGHKVNYFEASLWGRVDDNKSWTIPRSPQLRVKAKINCR